MMDDTFRNLLIEKLSEIKAGANLEYWKTFSGYMLRQKMLEQFSFVDMTPEQISYVYHVIEQVVQQVFVSVQSVFDIESITQIINDVQYLMMKNTDEYYIKFYECKRSTCGMLLPFEERFLELLKKENCS